MRVVAMMLALSVIMLAASPAHADFGAIAYDRDTGKRGWSVNAPTPQRAEQAALSQCGAGQCKVVIRIGPRQCAAVAVIKGKRLMGASSRPTRDAARIAALNDCQKRASGDCVVEWSDCNH